MGKSKHRDIRRNEDFLFNPEICRCLIFNFSYKSPGLFFNITKTKLMRKLIFSIAALITFSFAGEAQTDLKTMQEIQTVLTYYLDGGTNGDSVMFSKAFVPDGQMRYMRNDTVMNVILKDFMARARNNGVKQDRKTKI